MKIIEITTSPIDITCAIRSGPSIKLSVRKPSTKKRPTEYQIKYVKNNSRDVNSLFLMQVVKLHLQNSIMIHIKRRMIVHTLNIHLINNEIW